LVKGDGSSGFLHEIADILGEEFPKVRVETLPGGHAMHIFSMPDFMELLTSFIAKD